MSFSLKQSSIVNDCIERPTITIVQCHFRHHCCVSDSCIDCNFQLQKKNQEATFRFHLCNLVISFSSKHTVSYTIFYGLPAIAAALRGLQSVTERWLMWTYCFQPQKDDSLPVGLPRLRRWHSAPRSSSFLDAKQRQMLKMYRVWLVVVYGAGDLYG